MYGHALLGWLAGKVAPPAVRERWVPCHLTAGKVGARWERWVPCHLAAGKVGALPLFRDDSARGRRSVCGHEAT